MPQRVGLSRRAELRVPWELFLLNEGPDRCCLVTVCSNGALSGRLCLGLDGNTVLLYKLYTGKVLWKENHTLARFLEAYRRQFAAAKLQGGQPAEIFGRAVWRLRYPSSSRCTGWSCF